MRVKVGGKIITLIKDDLLHQGGEALIFDGSPDKVFKIYHQPSRLRAAKVRDLISSHFGLPDLVMVPEEEVVDSAGQLIGFSMKKLPDQFQPIVSLANRDFYLQYGWTNKKVANLFAKMHQDLSTIHQNGLVVGDLSGQNESIDPLKESLAWLDVDSWQFGRYPCMAAKEEYLSPDLYGIDLSKKPVFLPQHDWYSYVVLLFEGLLKAHPFRGFHPQTRSLTGCARKGLTIFDKGVRYPKAALPPEILSDELREEIVSYLKRKRADPFPLELLNDYRMVLVGCSSCGLWYPANLNQCPGCTTKTLIDAQLKAKVFGFEIQTLFETFGTIYYHQVVGSTIYFLEGMGKKIDFYQIEKGKIIRSMGLLPDLAGATYGFFDDHLVVCPQPLAPLPKLIVYDLEANTPQLVIKSTIQTTTERLAGGRAVFGCSARFLYRLAGPMILQGELFGQRDLAERQVTSAIPNQTWFKVAADLPREMLLGLMRNFEKVDWFLVVSDESLKKFYRFEVNLPPLDKGESMVEWSVRFSPETILVLRKTRKKGIDYIRVALLKSADGQVIDAYQEEISQKPFYANVGSKAYAHGILMHPTDDGVFEEEVTKRSGQVLQETSQFVQSDDRLDRYEGGLLVIKKDRLLLLKPKKGEK